MILVLAEVSVAQEPTDCATAWKGPPDAPSFHAVSGNSSRTSKQAAGKKSQAHAPDTAMPSPARRDDARLAGRMIGLAIADKVRNQTFEHSFSPGKITDIS